MKLKNGIPYGILNRIFQIRFGEKAGTCFVIDVDQKQYIVTAKHLVPRINPTDTVKISINENWLSLKIRVIFPKNEHTDIVALAANTIIAPKMEIFVSAGDIILGQDIYFLGFPYGLSSRGGDAFITKLAFVKKGILSAMSTGGASDQIMYVDGHNNPGFSGGPVIFANYSKQDRLQIAGVVSGYKAQPIKVYESEVKSKETKTDQEKKKFIQYVRENTGIVIAYKIGEILEAINKNPIGPIIPKK